MNSLTTKLTLAFLGISLAAILVVGALTSFIIRVESREFEQQMGRNHMAEQLVEHYEENDGWTNRPPRQFERSSRPLDGTLAVLTPDGDVVYTNRPNLVPNIVSASRIKENGTELVSDGETIGYLMFAGRQQGRFFNEVEEEVSQIRSEFLQATRRNIALAGVMATIFSIAVGTLVARSLIQPLQELRQATNTIAGGNLEEQVTVYRDDEIGELAHAFNDMSSQLKQSRDQRRRMTADIAHDLRTPLSVILGHAEGLKDGVLPATPETFHIIHDEAIRLNRLVEDLRTLSLADAGELNLVIRPIQPHKLFERAVSAHTPHAQSKNIPLRWSPNKVLPEISVDPDRIAQVFDNIIRNALRHTPAGGEVRLTTTQAPSAIQFTIQDNGEGMDADTLAHVFDRFYRADKSRQRNSGGSGLGLAISKSIVEQHGGTLTAASSPNRGSTFTVTLPTATGS